MELEIKHLAPYLPYGLEFMMLAEPDSKDPNIDTLKCIDTGLSMVNFGWGAAFEFKYIKPILKPLSIFEYDHIVQIKEHLGLGKWCDHYDQYFEAWFDDAENVQKLVLQCPYEIMQFFLEWHFDIFGLIDAGLAIDINTIKI